MSGRQSKALQKVLTENNCFNYWWAALPMIPDEKKSPSYKRLRRVWNDNTDTRTKDGPPLFFNPKYETHLTATLWENFELFDPKVWIPELCKIAEPRLKCPKDIKDCYWVYEQGLGDRLADVVIDFRDRNLKKEHLIVVESKNLNKLLSGKDLKPSNYLDQPDPLLSEITDRQMLYCVDESVKKDVAEQIEEKERYGIVTWQQLGGLQIRLAQKMNLKDTLRKDTLRSFVAGAIQFQFCIHNIRPSTLAAYYLNAEPMLWDRQQPKDERNDEREEQIWRLD